MLAPCASRAPTGPASSCETVQTRAPMKARDQTRTQILCRREGFQVTEREDGARVDQTDHSRPASYPARLFHLVPTSPQSPSFPILQQTPYRPSQWKSSPRSLSDKA